MAKAIPIRRAHRGFTPTALSINDSLVPKTRRDCTSKIPESHRRRRPEKNLLCTSVNKRVQSVYRPAGEPKVGTEANARAKESGAKRAHSKTWRIDEGFGLFVAVFLFHMRQLCRGGWDIRGATPPRKMIFFF